MPDKPKGGPMFKPAMLKKLIKWMQNEVAYVMRLQGRGILPYCKPAEKIIIETCDFERMLGMKKRTAQRYMAWLREELKKKKGQFVSVEEFVRESGLPAHVVHQALYLIPHEYPKEVKRDKK